jgi:D-lactate dehydrogenase
LISNAEIDQMKKRVMLISTGFGRLVNAEDVVQSPKCGRVGYFGMDIYEEEGALFFKITQRILFRMIPSRVS